MLKDTNPKDAVGVRKWRQYCTVPITIIWELGVAMLEGARKYGRHNYRVAGVRASVYVDAAKGHIDSWWEGEDVDADSGLSHITKAMASLAVLRDAMINDMVTDDRPPKVKDFEAFKAGLGQIVDEIMERHPDACEPFTELGQQAVRTSSPTVTPEELLVRMAEEKSRAALKAKQRVVAHTVDGIEILTADCDEFDREQVALGLTSKQLLRLVASSHDLGVPGVHVTPGPRQFAIFNPTAFDIALRKVLDRMAVRVDRIARLDFADGGTSDRITKLTSDEWFEACPGVRVTELSR